MPSRPEIARIRFYLSSRGWLVFHSCARAVIRIFANAYLRSKNAHRSCRGRSHGPSRPKARRGRKSCTERLTTLSSESPWSWPTSRRRSGSSSSERLQLPHRDQGAEALKRVATPTCSMANNDLQSFIRYITSLWGAFGGITAVFPLADVLFKVIPLPVDAYENSTAPIAIPVTSLVALFTLVYTFVQRDKSRSATARRSGMFFVLGMASLVAFFLLEHFEYPLRIKLFPGLDSTDDYVLLLVGVVPFYVAFFACVTRAFAILALMEFKRESGGLTNRSRGRP